MFGYCLGRLGQRADAEDAVEKTFSRAANALSRGELPDQELAWLLRIADRVCGSRRRLAWIRSRADANWLVPPTDEAERVRIVSGWEGRTFEEIAAEYDDRTARLMQARGDLAATLGRRSLSILNLGPVVGWLKTLLGGASALKVGAAAVAVTASTVVVASPLADRLHDAVRPVSQPTPGEQSPQGQPVRAGGGSSVSTPSRATTTKPAQQPARTAATKAKNTKRTKTLAPGSRTTTPSPSRATGAGAGAGTGAGAATETAPGADGPQGSPPADGDDGDGDGDGTGTSPKSTDKGSDSSAVSPPAASPPPVAPPPTPTTPTLTSPTVSTPTVTTPSTDPAPTLPVDTPDVPKVDTPKVDTPKVDPPPLGGATPPPPATGGDLPSLP